ncbi:MAG TPA: heavy metal-binding domain-containing protein [Streptosporangiaceae bacterium]|nr:heavy metal-binding domain-containing protein [Streptosporangiaceae bacterium]
MSTMNDLPGYQVTEVIGEVFGITVRSRNVGSQIGTGFKYGAAVKIRRAD